MNPLKTLNWRELKALAEQGELYALVDGRYPLWSGSPSYTLNPKDTEPDFFEIIAWSQVRYKPPVIVKATVEDAHFLFHHMAYERWGLFLRSPFSLRELGEHFQKFVIAKGPDGDPYFFKFQDGAVLDVFLSTWSRSTLNVFWGPLTGLGYMNFDACELQWHVRSGGAPHLIVPEKSMLSLHQSQLDECLRRIEQDLIKVIGWHLRSEHSQLVRHLNKDLLEERVAYGVRKARFYRLEQIADLAGFVALLFEVGPHFDHHPKVRAILTHHSGSPQLDKLQKLIHSMSEEEWQEAGLLGASWGWPKNFKKTGS